MHRFTKKVLSGIYVARHATSSMFQTIPGYVLACKLENTGKRVPTYSCPLLTYEAMAGR